MGNDNEKINTLTLKYGDEELMKRLKVFINEDKIQDLIFCSKKSSKDTVFNAVNENEKEHLIEYFTQIKTNFINNINSYLYSSQIQIQQNLIGQIITKEKGIDIFKEKITNEIKKINQDENAFKINNLTIMLIGKIGVGKSTLINKLLKLKGEEKAQTGISHVSSEMIKVFENEKIPFFRLIDSRGIELNQNFGAEVIRKSCENYIKEQLKTNNINNFIHCIWYCVTGNTFEDVEYNCINLIKKTYQNIPIIIVYTQATDEDAIKGMKEYLKQKRIENEFIEVLALEKKTRGGRLKSFGLSKLLKKTIHICKKSGDMHSVMISNISNFVETLIRKDNLRIKKYIKETNILNFINEYNIKNDEEFQYYVATIYAKNINYFFNKDLTEDKINIFKNANLILEHNKNFINYYKKIANNMINGNLESLSLKSLVIQADIEKIKKKPTLIENKRGYEDFIKLNKQFLLDNLYFLAQKHYIYYIFQNISGRISTLFENNLNNITHNLINEPNNKERINEIFLKRFKEFEEKIAQKDLIKLIKEKDEEEPIKNNEITINKNNENNEADKINLFNEFSDNATTIYNCKENENNQNYNYNSKENIDILKQNLKSNNFSNHSTSEYDLISSTNNTNQNSNEINSLQNNYKKYYSAENQSINKNNNKIKTLDDIQSVTTIPLSNYNGSYISNFNKQSNYIKNPNNYGQNLNNSNYNKINNMQYNLSSSKQNNQMTKRMKAFISPEKTKVNNYYNNYYNYNSLGIQNSNQNIKTSPSIKQNNSNWIQYNQKY